MASFNCHQQAYRENVFNSNYHETARQDMKHVTSFVQAFTEPQGNNFRSNGLISREKLSNSTQDSANRETQTGGFHSASFYEVGSETFISCSKICPSQFDSDSEGQDMNANIRLGSSDNKEKETPSLLSLIDGESNGSIGVQPTNQAHQEPVKKMRRLRANDRERRRMRSLNGALETLRKCIPLPQNKRRVTKLEILRLACNYISSLSETLRSGVSDEPAGHKHRINQDPLVNGFTIAQRLQFLTDSSFSC